MHTLVEWSFGDSFPVSREIHTKPGSVSNQGALGLQSNAQQIYQRVSIVIPLTHVMRYTYNN